MSVFTHTTDTAVSTNWKIRSKDMNMEDKFREALDGAVETALWSTQVSTDEGDTDYFAEDYVVSYAVKHQIRCAIAAQMRGWFIENIQDLEEYVAHFNGGWWVVGHDCWLTSEGHGVGFWDRGLGELVDRLTDSVRDMGGQIDFYDSNGELAVDANPTIPNTDKLEV